MKNLKELYEKNIKLEESLEIARRHSVNLFNPSEEPAYIPKEENDFSYESPYKLSIEKMIIGRLVWIRLN